MAFLRSVNPIDLGPKIYGRNVMLRVPQTSDYQAWAALREESRAFLTPWEPTWPRDDLTRTAFRRRIKRYLQDIRDDRAYPFLIFAGNERILIGGLTLSNVRRGVAMTCSVGYWIGERYARKGYMTDALSAVVQFCFDELALHRIEAACLPHNKASIALLKRCGFQEEGYARGYLKINGTWQDHLLFAILADDHAP